jgi:CheY-like chemotaxis protein
MPVRILVVEDHAPFRSLICTVLARAACETFEAADGLEAVRKAAELQPDVILLDINLPEIHGFDLAKQIPGIAPSSRLLFLSQETSPDIVQEALRLGAHGYIQKMSAATDLLPAIDAALAGQRFVSRSVALPEPAAAPAPRRHEVLFCSDDAAIVDGFARYVGAALNAGDAAIVVVTEPHRTALFDALRAQAVDIDGAVARGACVTFDAEVAPDLDRIVAAIDRARAAAAEAGTARPRLAICGERAGRLWAAGSTAAAVQLERFCNEQAYDVDILCLYPVPYTAGDPAIERICAEHTAVSDC